MWCKLSRLSKRYWPSGKNKQPKAQVTIAVRSSGACHAFLTSTVTSGAHSRSLHPRMIHTTRVRTSLTWNMRLDESLHPSNHLHQALPPYIAIRLKHPNQAWNRHKPMQRMRRHYHHITRTITQLHRPLHFPVQSRFSGHWTTKVITRVYNDSYFPSSNGTMGCHRCYRTYTVKCKRSC